MRYAWTSALHSHPWRKHPLVRITATLLGWELDVTLGQVETTAATEDTSPSDATSYAIGFTASHDVPEEVSAPQHCPSWDEPDDSGRRA